MAFAETGDHARIWYTTRAGSADAGLPLVLIQGLALDHHGSDSVPADFADRTVVLLDHRGTGDSDDRFPASWSTRDFARDVIAVMDAAGVPRAHVYGHSMGGRIAQWLGAEHADRVASLVLGATTVGGEGRVARSAAASEALALGGPALTAMFYPDQWIAENPSQAGSVAPAPRSPEAMKRHLAAVALKDGPPLEDIAAATFVIHGDQDQLAVPENAQMLARGIADARLVMIPGARHVYWISNPDVHQQVRTFLAEHDEPV